MKKPYILFLLFIVSFQLKATNIDSLKLVLVDTNSDAEKVEILVDIADFYKSKGNFTDALTYFNKADKLNPEKAIQFKIWLNIANAENLLQQYKKAFKQCEKILAAAPEDKKMLAKTYSLMSGIMLSLGDTNEAYELQYKSLHISEEIKDDIGLFLSFYQIGNIHFYQNNYPLALKKYKKALHHARKAKDERYIYSGLGAIGSTYHRMGNLEKSVVYNLKSLNLATEINYDVGIGYAAFNVGSDYFAMEKFDSCIIFLLKGLELQRQQQDKWGQSSSLRMLGEAYLGVSDLDNSLAYSKEALAIATETEARPLMMEVYKTLTRVLEVRGDFKGANKYLNNYLVLKDSLVNEETVEKIEAVETNYEVAKKERELLTKTNELNQIYGYILTGGLVVLLVFSWMIYSRYRSEQRNNVVLGQMNEQINEQNNKLRGNNKEIQRQNKKLAESNQELRRFAFIASHDLKEPLRNIGSYSSLLKRRYKGKLDEDADEFLDFITSGVSRMYKLLNEVMDYSKIDIEEKSMETIGLNDTVQQVIMSLGEQIEEKNAIIELETLPEINAKEVHFTQLFQNLIVNGLKYNENKKPVIKITCKAVMDKYVFAINDNGIGLDMIYKDKIFDMFQRLHGKNEYNGTGVGLAICKKIVNQYDGDIWVESKVNEGSTFFFSVPNIKKAA